MITTKVTMADAKLLTMVSLWVHVAVAAPIPPRNIFPRSPSNVSEFEGLSTNSPRPQRQCLALDSDLCPGSSWKSGVSLPNLYGHYTVQQALLQLRSVLDDLSLGSASSDLVRPFLCTLFLPPCSGQGDGEADGGQRTDPPPLPLPCRSFCEVAREEVRATQGKGPQSAKKSGWPSYIRCHVFPSERCYTMAVPGEVKYVIKALVASGSGATMRDIQPMIVASLDRELEDDEAYDVQVVTLGTNQVPPRRYDLSDLGDPLFFQGWADVQGTGAANDYCRVIGKGKRRFLSCALAGTRGRGHNYVSKLGFDPGHTGTWFMRDVDNDGRDDYCRCSGKDLSSRVVCMKAGDRGFYGSTAQGGSQYTFELPGKHNCQRQTLNPHFGI